MTVIPQVHPELIAPDTRSGKTLGLGARWEALPVVAKYSFLK